MEESSAYSDARDYVAIRDERNASRRELGSLECFHGIPTGQNKGLQ